MRSLPLLLAALCFGSAPALSQQLDPGTWVPDGTVFASAVRGDTLYLGGDFHFLGRYTGGAAAIDAASGLTLAATPPVRGTVRVIVPDGAGGWYLGGEFDQVDGVARQNLAHLEPDLSVSAWNPGANLSVYALALSGSTLYAGGSFTTCGGKARSGLAALDVTTGVASAWNPTADATVLALAVSGSLVYAGGQFSAIGSDTRHGIAAIRMNNGQATSWNPATNAGSVVRSLVVDGSTIYLGGSFIAMGGQSRLRIAQVDLVTGLATTWDPGADLDVRAMALSGSTLFIGGPFGNAGGQPRSRLAALDVVTGAATAWNPNVGPDAVITTVGALLVSGSTVYVAGDFRSAGGQDRRCLAALDAGTGLATSWNPNAGPSGQSQLDAGALAVYGSTVFAGGSFLMAGLVARERVAAIDLATGAPTSWNPKANQLVRCLATSGPMVFAGGDFTQVGGATHTRLAAIDAVTGVAAPWDAGATGSVQAVAAEGNTVYAGGSFGFIGSQSRAGIAALDAATGLATAWNPGAAGSVMAIAIGGASVYVGGTFVTIGSASRSRLAELDKATGLATAWNPSVTIAPGPKPVYVGAVALGPGVIYIGGSFDHVGADARDQVAAIDAVSGLATSWNPGVTGEVFALSLAGSRVYVGGRFVTAGGLPRSCLAAIDPAGNVTPWDPDVEPGALCCGISILSISVAGPRICVGGAYGQITGTSTLNASVLSDPFVVGIPAPGRTGGLALTAIAPQPMREASIVRFVLPRAVPASLELLDPAGRIVRRLLSATAMDAGPHETRLERGGLPSGLYFLRLAIPGSTTSRKLVIGP